MNFVQRILKKIGFRYAFNGLRFLMQEFNFRIHVLVATAVVIAAIVCNLDSVQWLWLSSAIGAVLVAEAFNTGLEKLCDAVTKEHRSDIGRVKDIGAAAVLLACGYALVVGLMVFLPYLSVD
jgi:diacylglycerol kinase